MGNDEKISKLVALAVEGNDEKTLDLVNFFNELYSAYGNFTKQELLAEGKKVKRAIQICREIASFLKERVEKGEEFLPKYEAVLPKYMKKLQEIMLYKNMVSTIFLEVYFANKFTFEEGDYIHATVLERVPACGHNGDGYDPVSQKKRRHGNDHTIQARLENLWNINISGEQREQEYDKLCDLVESVVYRIELIDKDSLRKEGRAKPRIQLFSLFNDRKRMPLDLFDSPLDDDIFGNNYRYVVKEFIQEVERAAGSDSIITYGRLNAFWKEWYKTFVDTVYMVACNNCPPEKVKKFYSVRHRVDVQKIPREHFKENLFSEVLFNLLKEEMKNDLYCLKYIIEHSQVVMVPLDADRHAVFKSWSTITQFCTYEEIWAILEKNENIVEFLMGDSGNIKKVFLQVKKIMETIIFPRDERIFFYQFFALMQCCVESYESELKIEHYGMPRGNKTVKLKTIIHRPKDNNCKEVRLFLFYIMRRRYFMNLFDKEIVDQIDQYRISWENHTAKCIELMEHWNYVKTDLDDLASTYLKTWDE